MQIDFLNLQSKLNDLEFEIDGFKFNCLWHLPTERGRGVLTTTTSFKVAKQRNKNPVEVADSVKSQLENSAESLGVNVSTAGPYVNVSMGSKLIESMLKSDPGSSLPPRDDHLMFEYIGANAAKRLHVGHMRNLNIGDALRRILKLRYPNITTDNHWGDWGVQFGIILWAYKQKADKEAYQTDPLAELQRLYTWGNQQKDSVDNWDNLVRAEFKKLEDGDEENRRLWAEFVEISKKSLKQTLDLFNIPPTDLEQGESFYDPHMKELAEFCDNNDLWVKEGNSRYFDFEDIANVWEGSDQMRKQAVSRLGRCYLISSDGYTTYAFRDVAARFQWARDHKIDKAITVTDDRQAHNFKQAFAIIAYLASLSEFKQQWGAKVADRLNLDSLVHVPYGRLKLETGDISTRKGNVPLLDDLYHAVEAAVIAELQDRDLDKKAKDKDFLNKLVLAAIKWHDLQSDPVTTVVLRPDQIVSFEGDTGVYQLYSYARLRSILRQQGDGKPANTDVSTLTVDELRLLEQAFAGQAVLEQAVDDLKPTYVVNHLRDITQNLNNWYTHNSLKHEQDPTRKETLLVFVAYMSGHLKEYLSLLGISTAESI